MLERVLLLVLRFLIRIFFRAVEVNGAENVPLDRGGVLVAWHPNALVDPCLLFATFPGQVAFGARHGLFEWPVLGRIMRSLGAVPIYRAMDQQALTNEQRLAANLQSLSALANRVGEGAYAALFPEGLSHDEPHLAPIKTGAARLYFQALALQPAGAPPPVIIPVGLHYNEKHLFRSSALVWFHPPLVLPPELNPPAADSGAAIDERRRTRQLTNLIELALEDAIHPTEDWQTHRLIHRVRKLVRAERAMRAGIIVDKPTLEEKTLAFARVQRAYYDRLAADPKQAAKLRASIERYDENLAALGLDDHELDSNPPVRGIWLLLMTLLQFLFVFLLLPPLLLLGYLVNGTAAVIVLGSAKLLAKKTKDVASYKLLVGSVIFPLTWLAVIPLGVAAHEWFAASFPLLPDTPILSGVILAVASIIGGAHALRYQHVARQSWKNLRVRFRRRQQRDFIAATLAVRAGIFEKIMAVADAIEQARPVAAGQS